MFSHIHIPGSDKIDCKLIFVKKRQVKNISTKSFTIFDTLKNFTIGSKNNQRIYQYLLIFYRILGFFSQCNFIELLPRGCLYLNVHIHKNANVFYFYLLHNTFKAHQNRCGTFPYVSLSQIPTSFWFNARITFTIALNCLSTDETNASNYLILPINIIDYTSSTFSMHMQHGPSSAVSIHHTFFQLLLRNILFPFPLAPSKRRIIVLSCA